MVWGLGNMVSGLGCRFQGLRLRGLHLGFTVKGSRFGVQDLGD